jgi:hypothetical protein
VRDVEPFVVERQQPTRHERIDHRAAHPAPVPVQVELGEPGRSPDERTALVGVGQPDEQAPGDLALLLVQGRPGRLGGPAQRSRDAAGLQVSGQGEPIPSPALPGADQRRREQGQGTRPAEDVGDHRIDELVLDGQANRAGGLPDDVAQFRVGERRDEDDR